MTNYEQMAEAEASKMVAPSNLKQLADSFPELNPSNYGAEDVDELHNWALEVVRAITAIDQEVAHGAPAQTCTCPSGDGSLRWPCPTHPPSDAHHAAHELFDPVTIDSYCTRERAQAQKGQS